MEHPEPTILRGWLEFAVRAFALLTSPPADVTRCDREIEALARDSVAGQAVHAVTLAIRRAWRTSRTRSASSAALAVLTPSDQILACRLWGWIVAVVGATALVIEPFGTASAGPLIWVLPAILVATGLFVTACAGPLCRAAADRRHRTSPSS